MKLLDIHIFSCGVCVLRKDIGKKVKRTYFQIRYFNMKIYFSVMLLPMDYYSQKFR